MTQENLDVLLSQYPAIIEQMQTVFTSHEFILRLAQQNQRAYIDLLHAYRDSVAPFQVVHGRLAHGLRGFPNLVEYIDDVSSTDIFGQTNYCARWRKC